MRARNTLFGLVTATMLATVVACTEERPKPPAAEDASASSSPSAAPSVPVPDEAKWLVQGSSDERFVKIASQLRGFDVAMVETGYRYGELYWAGRDENYDYARYQLQKIETTIARGVERRPKREPSSHVLDGPKEGLMRAINSCNHKDFDTAFAALTVACNTCHVAEKVPFVHVAPPTVRTSVVHGPDAGAP